jgi:hypothetical protein
MSGLDRRAFLKGLGTMMALPALESVAPVSAIAQIGKKAAAPPIRMAFIFTPNGVDIPSWTPAKEGVGFDLPYILEPLKDVQSDINVLTGLAQHNAFALGDGPGDHARSTAAWLTGVHPRKTAGADIKNGISADQVAAQKIGYKTKFASLEIGCERSGVSGDCDSGYSCAYSSNISWRSENTPVAKEINPRLVFERLFGNGDAAEGEESLSRRNLFRQSILDFVSEDARSLRNRLGTHDQRKLDEYLAGIREIEERLVKFEKSAGMWAVKAGIERPTGIPGNYGEHIRLMGDMMILAFQADLTRIGTFMYANDGNNRSYREIGVPEGHHDMSHHGKDPHKVDQKRKIDRFHVEQLAYMINKMRSIKEGNGTLLDNCMIVYGAGISDGDRHNHDDLPILFAGKAGGRIQTGRHMRYEKNTPMNNLFLSMLDRVGVDVETLGDSTGKLQGLF